jgi:hypothetical protein
MSGGSVVTVKITYSLTYSWKREKSVISFKLTNKVYEARPDHAFKLVGLAVDGCSLEFCSGCDFA